MIRLIRGVILFARVLYCVWLPHAARRDFWRAIRRTKDMTALEAALLAKVAEIVAADTVKKEKSAALAIASNDVADSEAMLANANTLFTAAEDEFIEADDVFDARLEELKAIATDAEASTGS